MYSKLSSVWKCISLCLKSTIHFKWVSYTFNTERIHKIVWIVFYTSCEFHQNFPIVNCELVWVSCELCEIFPCFAIHFHLFTQCLRFNFPFYIFISGFRIFYQVKYFFFSFLFLFLYSSIQCKHSYNSIKIHTL